MSVAVGIEIGRPQRLRERQLRALLARSAGRARRARCCWRAPAPTPRSMTTGPPASIGVDSGCTVSSGCPSTALSFALAAMTAPSVAVASFSAAAKREVGLQHFEPRHVACFEARLRRVAGALGDRSRSSRRTDQPRVGDEHVVVRAPDVVANLRDRRGQFGVAGANRRLADRDPFLALAAELERQREAERLLRRLLFDLDCGFWIQSLAGDGEAGRVDRAAQACRSNRRVRGQSAVDRGLKRQRSGLCHLRRAASHRGRQLSPATQPTKRENRSSVASGIQLDISASPMRIESPPPENWLKEGAFDRFARQCLSDADLVG